MYQSVRDRDHAGTTKIQLGTATFIDPAQARRAAAGSTSFNRRSSAASGSLLSSSLDSAALESADGGGGGGGIDDAGPGVILAAWNPDASWEEEQLVRIYAIHGALEQRHVVYEHIEVGCALARFEGFGWV